MNGQPDSDEINIRISYSSVGIYDLLFENKSHPYAQSAMRMLWVYSNIRRSPKDAETNDVPNKKQLMETINTKNIPNRFVVPRVPKDLVNRIPTAMVV